MALTLRSTKGSPLTHDELDANFSGLADGSLISAADASVVNFTPSGTGAPSRPVSEKLQEVPSVKDAGAEGDGSSNDDAEFAVAEAWDEDFIYLPDGDYVITDEITKKYYGPGKVNGKPLFNWDRIQPIPHAARLWHKIRAQDDDVYIIVLGDSTGNSTTEWVYLWATQLGVDASTHTVKYRLFEDGTGWGSESTISTGSGSKTIYVDNVSVTGKDQHYMTGANNTDIYSLSRTYDYAILNYGHNYGTTSSVLDCVIRWTEAFTEARYSNPRATICAIMQNPNTAQLVFSSRVTQALREIAQLHGVGLINVYDVFSALGNPTALYATSDTVHPSEAGQRVWTAVVSQAMGESMGHQALKVPQLSFREKRVNYAPNPAFYAWDASSPTSWTATNVTVTRDMDRKETGPFSVKLVATSSTTPKIEANLDGEVHHLKGKWVTAMARVWRESGANTNCARLQLNGTSLGTVSGNNATAEEGWAWQFIQCFIPAAETTLKLRVLGGSASSDTGWIDRIWFGEGLVPGDVDWTAQGTAEIADYFAETNAGIGGDGTGTLTFSGNDATLTGAQSGCRFYVNLSNLVPGQQYTVTWSRGDSNSGDVFVRQGQNGAGTVTVTETLEGDGSITWTATLTNETILFASDSSFTGMIVNDISIVKATNAVTQATSKSTSVTLNAIYGQVTMNGAALASGTTVTFTLTNSQIEATDVLILNHVSGGTAGAYLLNAQAASGSASVNVRNITGGSLSEAIVVGFKVVKASG